MTLLAALALCLQDKTAEETFKKIEETIQGAKTLQIKFKLLVGHADASTNSTGTLSLKAGNKLHFTYRVVQFGAQKDYWVISDGAKVVSSKSPRVAQEVPKDFDRTVRVMLVRLGAFACLHIPVYLNPKERTEQFSDGCFNVEGLSQAQSKGPADGRFSTLTYQLRLFGSKGKRESRLRFDPKTYGLIEHHDSGSPELSGSDHTETYDEFLLNADIPDEKFKLPAEK